MTNFYRNVARVLIVSVCCLGLPVRTAQAELVATDRLETAQGVHSTARQRLESLLMRDDVRAELQRYGVSATEAKARVEALSDGEVERLAAQVDSLPAGGDGGITAILLIGFLVFVTLLVTDILGFTKVFSFTRPAK